MGARSSRSADSNSDLVNSFHLMDADCSSSTDCQGMQDTSEDAGLKMCAPDATNTSASTAAVVKDNALEQEFLTIEQGLKEYCENPTATSFMRIYTCIYDLCNERKRKHVVCKAVYDKYHVETALCAEQLRDSMSGLLVAPGAPWQESVSHMLHSWCHLQRRIHALQASFGYLDRYYVPRSQLATLSDVRLALLEEAGLEEQAEVMWSSIGASIRDGHVRMGCTAIQELASAWVSLMRVAGLEKDSMLTCVANALREHLVIMLSSGKSGGTAVDRVLRMQPPLVQLIAEYLSEQDLCEVYSVERLQRSK